MLTASFSEARKNLTDIAARVAEEGVEYTIFKRSKPLFKIVPVDQPETHRLPCHGWSRKEAAAHAEERARAVAEVRATGCQPVAGAAEVTLASRARRLQGFLGEMPDGGEELFAYMEQLRDRMPTGTPLASMKPADLKRELANRDV